jgi:hypothetical protein
LAGVLAPGLDRPPMASPTKILKLKDFSAHNWQRNKLLLIEQFEARNASLVTSYMRNNKMEKDRLEAQMELEHRSS